MTFEFSKELQFEDPTETHTYNSFDHLTVVAKEGKAPGELWFPSCVAFDRVSNHIYVAEGDILDSFARVSIFSESGDFLNSYTHEEMKVLHGITIHGSNIYITDYSIHCVFHFKIEPNFSLVGMLGCRGSGMGQFDQPRELSTSTKGDVYIADRDNNRIQIIDSSLHPIRAVTHSSMHKPCDVKLTTDEMYVLCPVDSPCVHVFTHTGEKIRSLISCGEGMKVIKPQFLCLDIEGNFLISDWVPDLIKRFSDEGALHHTIGESGCEAGTFDFINGIVLTSNLSLVCLSWNPDCVLQIFSV